MEERSLQMIEKIVFFFSCLLTVCLFPNQTSISKIITYMYKLKHEKFYANRVACCYMIGNQSIHNVTKKRVGTARR